MFAGKVFHRLLANDPPVPGVQQEGRLHLDTGALFASDVGRVAEAIATAIATAGATV